MTGTKAPVVGIFVGGESRRMGGLPKGLLPSPETGEPIVQRLVRVVQGASPHAQIVLVGSDPRLQELSLPVVADQPGGIGPIGGLVALLRLALAHDTTAIALAADLPFVTAALLRRLMRGAPQAHALAPRIEDVWNPLLARYEPAPALQAALAHIARGRYALRHVLASLGERAVALPLHASDGQILADWDSPSDIGGPVNALAGQALALRDRLGRPLRDLRISVTDRCNFRCDYCMPAQRYGPSHRFLPTEQLLSFDAIERLAKIFVERLGVRKLRVTGGEPLLRPELPRLIERLARISSLEDLSLTTNGYLLAPVARELATAGLQRVTVSLDAVDETTFARSSGAQRRVQQVLDGIEAAAAAGLEPLKINCVVQRGVNEHAVEDLARRFRHTGHVLRFIEYMDVGTLNDWHPDRVVPADEILRHLSRLGPLTPVPPSAPGEVAERYRFVDGGGEVGVIASVTRPFCGSCQRARLSAQGQLLTCLFARRGLDLRSALRTAGSDAALEALVRANWQARSDRYSEQRFARPHRRRRRLEMYQIGG